MRIIWMSVVVFFLGASGASTVVAEDRLGYPGEWPEEIYSEKTIRANVKEYLGHPGVYTLARSTKNIADRPSTWRKEIIYVEMTNSKGGLKGRIRALYQEIAGPRGAIFVVVSLLGQLLIVYAAIIVSVLARAAWSDGHSPAK